MNSAGTGPGPALRRGAAAGADPDADSLSVRAAAVEAPDRLALIAGERAWTWAELGADIERETTRLREMGALTAGSGDGATTHRVVFDAVPDPATVITMFALAERGVTIVPLHPRFAAPERGAHVAMVGDGFDLDRSRRSGEDARMSGDETRRMFGDETRRAADARPLAARPGRSRPFAILFTSGSGGAPRPAALSRRAFRASAAASAARLGWEDDDRWLCCLPLAHVGGLSILTRCLIARRTIVLAPGFDAAGIAATIERERVTLASFVPAMLTRLFALDPPWRPPPFLRAALLGGSPAGDALWREIERRDLAARATYGMTETCSQIATATAERPRRLIPLDSARIRVADGRIEVAGPMLCERDEDAVPATGAAWTPDGFFRTGDLGAWAADGTLEVFGRADQTIVTGGENVAPEEVEAALELHPDIERAVVFGVRDEQWGEVVAAVLVSGARRPAPDDLRDWMSGRLAGFKRPRLVGWLAELPETPTGKPDRGAVRRLPPDVLGPL